MNGTLTTYPQLKAYWFNPDKTRVEMKLRDTQDLGEDRYRQDYLAKLEIAKKLVAGRL